MKLSQTVVAAVLAAAAVLPSAAFAKGHGHMAKTASTMTCPACKMSMPSKASAKTPVAVKIGNHTYYCCAACPAGKAHAHPMHHGKKK